MILFFVKIGLLVFHLLAWCAVGHILLTKQDPRSALGWTAVLLLVPVVGLCLYVLFGISRTQSRAAAIMREKARGLPTYAHKKIEEPAEGIPRYLRQMERLGRTLTGQNLCAGNTVEPLFNGNMAYPAMLEAIRRARRHVYLVTYIFNSGEVAEKFVEELSRAADRGVDVRVLLDGVGRFYSFRSPMETLAKRGVQVGWFLPPRLFPPNLMINLRNHRKIMVCDDVAFTGGMNIADYHVVLAGRKNAAKDIQYRVTGPVVMEYCRAFHIDWGYATGHYDAALPEPAADGPKSAPEDGQTQATSFCRLVLDGPGTGSDPLNDLIAGSIGNAAGRVVIMTPYFLPTREIVAALRIAAEKGVDVRVILPAKNNLAYVHWASQRVLPSLLQAGVRVFYQPPPFAHTKLLCVDDYYCQIGSANLDSRSLRLNFELNTEVFDRDFNARMTAFTTEVLRESREFTMDDVAAMSLPARLRSAVFWLFSPYL